MRFVLFLLLCSGCDMVFGLHDLKPDAPIDVLDLPPPDAFVPPDPIGCADGIRDVMDDGRQIAGCAGGWSSMGIPGTGSNSASALCSPNGWHICHDESEASTKGAAQLCTVVPAREFYATAQGSSAVDACDNMGADDIFGCGLLIGSQLQGCGALNTSLGTNNLPPDLGQWDVGGDGKHERDNVRKGIENGGVMCCIDD